MKLGKFFSPVDINKLIAVHYGSDSKLENLNLQSICARLCVFIGAHYSGRMQGVFRGLDPPVVWQLISLCTEKYGWNPNFLYDLRVLPGTPFEKWLISPWFIFYLSYIYIYNCMLSVDSALYFPNRLDNAIPFVSSAYSDI